MVIEATKEELKRYLSSVIREEDGKTIPDFGTINDYVISSDPVRRQWGKRANQTLTTMGILTDIEKDGSWHFSEKNMNPLAYIVDVPERVGRVGFATKESIIRYGAIVWPHRLDNWTITNGKEVLARRDIY